MVFCLMYKEHRGSCIHHISRGQTLRAEVLEPYNTSKKASHLLPKVKIPLGVAVGPDPSLDFLEIRTRPFDSISREHVIHPRVVQQEGSHHERHDLPKQSEEQVGKIRPAPSLRDGLWTIRCLSEGRGAAMHVLFAYPRMRDASCFHDQLL